MSHKEIQNSKTKTHKEHGVEHHIGTVVKVEEYDVIENQQHEQNINEAVYKRLLDVSLYSIEEVVEYENRFSSEKIAQDVCTAYTDGTECEQKKCSQSKEYIVCCSMNSYFSLS